MISPAAIDDLKECARKAFTQPFGAVIKLAPTDQAPVWVDGRTTPPVIGVDAPAGTSRDCTWHGALDALEQALESERTLENAYLSGRITISGDMSVMTRLTMERMR